MWDQGSSSMVFNKYSQDSNSLVHTGDAIESLASQLEKIPLENNKDKEANHSRSISKQFVKDDVTLELKLACNNSPIAPIDEPFDTRHRSSLFHVIGRETSIKILIRCPRYGYASVASLNRSFHDLIKNGEIYRERIKNQVLEHWVYFSCYKLKWEAFDPVSKKWMNPPMIKSDPCFEYSDKESMAVGNELLVLGKGVSGQAVYKYSLLTNSWIAAKPMNKPRCLFGSASLGKIAIFAGGVNENGKIMDAVESYNNETGAWETLPRLLKARKMSSGVFMDGRFYVIGGCGEHDMKPLSCGEEYDLVAQKWRVIPDMWPGGGGCSMAPPLLAVVDNELYSADCAKMEVKKYDKKLNVWESIGQLPKRVDNIAGWGIAFRGCWDRVIIVGGPRTHEDAHVEIYSWVPIEGPSQWNMIGKKKSDNFVYCCAIMGC